MIHRLMLLIVLFTCQLAYAQNLIPNPSFEDTICTWPGYDNPFDFPFYTPAEHWFNPNDATPDFYSVGHSGGYECGFLSMFSLQTSGEWQFPKDGERIIGLWSGNEVNITRELLACQLLEPLVEDSLYCFSMYVSLRNGSNLAIDHIGAYFSADSVYDHSWAGGFDIPMNITNPTGQFLADTLLWMEVSGEYLASGGERYLLIGNADDDSETQYIDVEGGGNVIDIAYYYVDDLSLVPCSSLGLNDLETSRYFSAFYFSGELIISAPVGTSWQLYDLQGRICAFGDISFDGEAFALENTPGLYIIAWTNVAKQGSLKLYIE